MKDTYQNNLRAGKDISSNFVKQMSEEQEIQIFVKQMLVHKVFLGHYQERRYVDLLMAYRDVVVLHSTETELQRDLNRVQSRLERYYSTSSIWIGITGPNIVGAPAGHSMWVKLHDLPFGSYWFQIREVKFSESQEIFLRLKCLRSIDSEVASAIGINQQEPPKMEKSEEPVLPKLPVVPSIHSRLQDFSLEEVVSRYTSLLTLHNAKEATCFMSVLLVACITGFFHIIKYLGDFTIKLMREFSHFIQVTTPIFIAIIEFFAKCVGGLYILIAMMIRGTPAKFPPAQMQHKVPYRALPMPPRYSNFQK